MKSSGGNLYVFPIQLSLPLPSPPHPHLPPRLEKRKDGNGNQRHLALGLYVRKTIAYRKNPTKGRPPIIASTLSHLAIAEFLAALW